MWFLDIYVISNNSRDIREPLKKKDSVSVVGSCVDISLFLDDIDNNVLLFDLLIITEGCYKNLAEFKLGMQAAVELLKNRGYTKTMCRFISNNTVELEYVKHLAEVESMSKRVITIESPQDLLSVYKSMFGDISELRLYSNKIASTPVKVSRELNNDLEKQLTENLTMVTKKSSEKFTNKVFVYGTDSQVDTKNVMNLITNISKNNNTLLLDLHIASRQVSQSFIKENKQYVSFSSYIHGDRNLSKIFKISERVSLLPCMSSGELLSLEEKQLVSAIRVLRMFFDTLIIVCDGKSYSKFYNFFNNLNDSKLLVEINDKAKTLVISNGEFLGMLHKAEGVVSSTVTGDELKKFVGVDCVVHTEPYKIIRDNLT